jgi:hypothetical protein
MATHSDQTVIRMNCGELTELPPLNMDPMRLRYTELIKQNRRLMENNIERGGTSI